MKIQEQTDYATWIGMTKEEAKDICRLGRGKKTCAFLVCGSQGFSCVRMAYPTSATIFNRLESGEINAKGKGEWKKCYWIKELK